DKELPERFRVVYTAGKPATDSDKGNAFFAHTIIYGTSLTGENSISLVSTRVSLAPTIPVEELNLLTKRWLYPQALN
ncbi:MAG TPA: hypothetical protein VIT23_11255, partial [Terrimicrobiaceae bacterium]